MAVASYQPRILSPKYGQTASVKPLTANRCLPFNVCGKMAKSISWVSNVILVPRLLFYSASAVTGAE